jgi:hypothetical protein
MSVPVLGFVAYLNGEALATLGFTGNSNHLKYVTYCFGSVIVERHQTERYLGS